MGYSYDEHIEKKIALMSNAEQEKELKKIYMKSKKQSEQIKQLTYKVNSLKSIIRELRGDK